MTEQTASFRQILTSTSIIGGASVLNILIGLLRTKVVAVLLGPAGIGTVSLLQGLMSAASAVATMGLGTVGPRQVAEAVAQQDARALVITRRAMLFGTVFLALSGGAVVWALRDILAQWVLGDVQKGPTVGWLALGVSLSVAGTAQGALIQGMRRIGDMARLSIYSSALNTVFGLGLLWWLGSSGLLAYVLLGPAVTFALGHWYVSRLPKQAESHVSVSELTQQWKTLIRLGAAFMGAGIAATFIQLWIRVLVQQESGTEALGSYQAASTLSMQYIGFVLGAMAADYYPRLTSVITDPVVSTRLVNEQTEIALLLSTPIFIAMMGLAPWLIHLLYSAEFMPAVAILRWQILGDVLKVFSWPMGFVILAAGAGKTFFLTETSTLLLMAILTSLLMPFQGLPGAGIAYLAAYIYLTPLVYFVARRHINFRWTPSVIRLAGISFLVCGGVGWFAATTPLGGWAALPLALLAGLYSVGRLSKLSEASGIAGRIGAWARKLTLNFSN